MADEVSEDDLKKIKFSPSFNKEGLPACLSWTPDDVAEWIEYIGFPEYKVNALLCNVLASRVQRFIVCYCF